MSSKLFSKEISILFLSIGLLSIMAYKIIAATSIGESGYLHEPSTLIPIGWFFLCLGGAIGLVSFVKDFTKEKRS